MPGLSHLRLGIEENVAQQGDEVENEEDVKVSEANGRESLRAELSEDEVDDPVGEGGNGIAQGSDLDGEDLGRVAV